MFEQDFVEKYGRQPSQTPIFFYGSPWTAMKVTELAGIDTDTQPVVRVARSGQLRWDWPAGPFTIGTDGETIWRWQAKGAILYPLSLTSNYPGGIRLGQVSRGSTYG